MVDKKALIKEIIKIGSKGDKWLDAVPSEISSAFFDNPYVESMSRTTDLLLSVIFTEEELGWVYWILYDWSDSRTEGLSFVVDNTEYNPKTRDEAIDLVFSLKLI